MQQNASETAHSPKRGRPILFAVLVLVAAFAVWKVIGYREQPPAVLSSSTPESLDALRYLAEAKTSANDAGADFDKSSIFEEIAAEQARAGDVPAAWATANALTEGPAKSSAVIGISMAQAERGDFAGAQSSAK